MIRILRTKERKKIGWDPMVNNEDYLYDWTSSMNTLIWCIENFNVIEIQYYENGIGAEKGSIARVVYD